ncbi:hypothetical protein JHK85_024537 [Glycine max]|nr:hypothetical protein JHK85_024537 [Glycine max]KAG5011787.1 hypothetical protein JHK86_024048 [Glycine max]
MLSGSVPKMKSILPLSLSIAIVYIVSSEIGIAFARDSTALAPEPLADSPAPDEIPPADSAEPPTLDNNPSYDGSAEYIELYSTLLEYFDVTRNGAVADGRTDSSSAPISLNDFPNPEWVVLKNLNAFNLNLTGLNHVSIHRCESIDFYGFKIHSPGSSPNTDRITISQSNKINITSSTIGVGDMAAPTYLCHLYTMVLVMESGCIPV